MANSMLPMRSVAVLGAGTMGAQIAAHFANAGVPVLLLDLTADAAREGLKRARALKPDPFFAADTAAVISIGGFDTDLPKIATADWILEGGAIDGDAAVIRSLVFVDTMAASGLNVAVSNARSRSPALR